MEAPPEVAGLWATQAFPVTLVVDFFRPWPTAAAHPAPRPARARNRHHAAEAAFKAVALALRQAVARPPEGAEGGGEVPSTKGTLDR